MIARTVMGYIFVPDIGFTAVCFASPAAWICADLFLIPGCAACISVLRRREARGSGGALNGRRIQAMGR